MNQSLSSKSTFLFALPNFLRGAARALDMGSTFDAYNEDKDADRLALSSDWKQVGIDLTDAMEQFEDA